MTYIQDAYADPAIAAKQRVTAELELKAMRSGRPPAFFQIVGNLLAEIVLTLPAPITLLDAGCGSAYYSEVVEYFVPNCYIYTGADYNPGMVALARELYPSLTIYQANLCSLGFDDRSFDVVLSGACIGHMPEWMVALSELTRVAGVYLILHRNPVWLDDTPTTFDCRNDYDTDVLVYQFNERELLSYILGDFDLMTTRDARSPAPGATRTYLFRRKGTIA